MTKEEIFEALGMSYAEWGDRNGPSSRVLDLFREGGKLTIPYEELEQQFPMVRADHANRARAAWEDGRTRYDPM